MKNRHVDGMVLMGSTFIEENSEDNAYIRQAATNVPVVLLNGSFQCPNVFCVLCDDERAMKEAMNQLLDSGCTTPATTPGSASSPDAGMRWRRTICRWTRR